MSKVVDSDLFKFGLSADCSPRLSDILLVIPVGTRKEKAGPGGLPHSQQKSDRKFIQRKTVNLVLLGPARRLAPPPECEIKVFPLGGESLGFPSTGQKDELDGIGPKLSFMLLENPDEPLRFRNA